MNIELIHKILNLCLKNLTATGSLSNNLGIDEVRKEVTQSMNISKEEFEACYQILRTLELIKVITATSFNLTPLGAAAALDSFRNLFLLCVPKVKDITIWS